MACDSEETVPESYLTVLDADTDTESDMEEEIAMDVEYHNMLSQLVRSEHTPLQEAHCCLYEQYTDAKRRW
eukprot:754246-Prorocentrum_lima.AAC.1